jgi:hypothetical protein
MTVCKNCNHSFEGKFCNNCGQSAKTREINFKNTIQEFQQSIIQIDKGIFFTTKQLLLKPGLTIREYLEGKRVNHFKPFAYILVLSTIYALLSISFNKSTFITEFIDGVNAGITEKSTNKLEFLTGFFEWATSNYAYFTLLTIPIWSLASYLCFIRAKFNYFEHLILNSYLAGLRTVIYLMILSFTFFIEDQSINDGIDVFKSYLGMGLTFLVYYQFFNLTSPFKKIFLTLLTYNLLLILTVIIFFALAFISLLWS